MILCHDRTERLIDWGWLSRVARTADAGEEWSYQSMPMRAGHRGQRTIDALASEVFSAVIDLDDERLCCLQHVTLQPHRDPAERLIGERPFAVEDRRAWNRPVDALRGG